MTSGFARYAAHSVFEALRPAPDQAIDRVAFATYSLDLVAVAALILSLGRAGEQELEAGPLGLVDAFAAVAPRIDIVHQKDRLRAAPRHHGILHTLDRRMHAIQPPRGASYHPKLALARYFGPNKGVAWKLWLGSRNLTGGQDREAGLLIVGRVGGRIGKQHSEIAAMAVDILAPVGWVSAHAEELRGVRWRAPEGVSLRRLQWRRAGEQKPFLTELRGATSTLGISPFVDDAGCRVFKGGTNGRLVTTAEAASGIDASHVAIAVYKSPIPSPPMADEPPAATLALDGVSVPEPAGLHAKLLLRRKEEINRLWIGSANLTRRGMSGPNAEVIAELDISANDAQALVEFADEASPFEEVQIPLDPEEARRRVAERALEEALRVVLEADLELRRELDGLRLFSNEPFDTFLAEHSLEVWLLTQHDGATLWRAGERSVLLAPKGVPLKLETVLVCFRAGRLTNDCPERTWAQAVRFPEHDPDARDRAATAAYIGLDGASAWLRAQLEGVIPPEANTWTGTRRWAGSEFAGAGDQLPLALEEVLGAWARNPDEFERRALRLKDILAALGAELAQLADENRDEAAVRRWAEVTSFWAVIREAIGTSHGA